ncbi:MAG TPA: O-antigen ligase family protein, partial [Thermoguttaceae bacterium]|nr:O-antigen ligase family protein [Thermoguttaceae bacterium]
MTPPNSTRRQHRHRHERSHKGGLQVEHAEASPHGRIEAILLGLMDAGLAGCIIVVPFLLGGRHPIGQTALLFLTSMVVVAWALRQTLARHGRWRPTWASWLLLAGATLVAFQWVPLSHEWLAWCSPETTRLLPLWSPSAETSSRLGTWNCISLAPEETRAGWMLFISYSALFLATVQRVDRVEDIERILRWCALAAVLMAAFGLIQYFTSNGKYFWFHEAPYSSTEECVKGGFTNRNHFADFLALGIGPLIWWLCRANVRREPARGSVSTRRGDASNVALVVAVVAVVFAALLSLSRGGNTALLLAAMIAAVVCGRAAALQGRFLFGVVAAGVLVIVALNCFGYEKVSQRLSDLSAGSIERLDRAGGRRRVWRAVAGAIPDFALFGSGVGSHREVCPVYLKNPVDGCVFTHAENSPLQEALETGLTGGALLAAGIGFCAFWCVGGLRRAESARLRACLGAVAAGLAASLVHSLVDFVWYVPACMAVVAILAGLACRAWQLGRPSRSDSAAWRLPRVAAVTVALFAVVLSIDMIGNRFRATVAEHYWDRACIAVERAARTPPEQRDVNVPENRRREMDVEKRILADLEQVVRWYPEHAAAHLSLARCRLHLFDMLQMTSANPMSLPQIRDAVIASQDRFPSPRARDEWMRRALGDHCEHLHHALVHVRTGLRRSPLQAKGYLYLAELCFLDKAASAPKQAYLEQALRVRPYDGDVLETAARETYEAILSGDLESWLTFARRTVRSETRCKKRLIEDLVNVTPPEGIGPVIEFIVTQLQPDLEGLVFLHGASKPRASAEQLKPLQQFLAQTAERDARRAANREAAPLWRCAAGAYVDLGEPKEAIRCLRGAHASDPGNVDVRYRLGCLLLVSGDAEE